MSYVWLWSRHIDCSTPCFTAQPSGTSHNPPSSIIEPWYISYTVRMEEGPTPQLYIESISRLHQISAVCCKGIGVFERCREGYVELNKTSRNLSPASKRVQSRIHVVTTTNWLENVTLNQLAMKTIRFSAFWKAASATPVSRRMYIETQAAQKIERIRLEVDTSTIFPTLHCALRQQEDRQ